MLSNELKTKLDGISKCSKQGKHKVTNLYKILVNNLELWDMAHQYIASNRGATTRGIDDVTVDGYSDERVIALMELLKQGNYNPVPVRRTYIPKSNGKKRPLGIPNDHDKLVQSACKILLEAVYEPIFHENSYGFRPKRGSLDALWNINMKWRGTKWFIEFDIKSYFDSINHKKLMDILAEKIDDKRFLALIRKMLKAGYMEEFVYNKTYSGTPQGGVISPLLANVYLDKLDTFAEDLCQQNCYGKERGVNIEARNLTKNLRDLKKRIQRKDEENDLNDPLYQSERRNELEKYKNLQKRIMELRPSDDFDKSYRKLMYCRYADDFVLGYIGSKEEATEIMEKITNFLKDELHLEVSEEKTKIENHKKGIRFLGYDIRTASTQYFKKKVVHGAPQYRRYGTIIPKLWIPEERVIEFCKSKGYGNYAEVKSTHRAWIVEWSDAQILEKYNAELRGYFQYYKLAHNYSMVMSRLWHIADMSARKTLANKHKSSVHKVSKIYSSNIGGDKRLAVRVERNNRTYKLVKPSDINRVYKGGSKEAKYDFITDYMVGRNDLTRRRKLETCELCGTETAYVEEHHVRALKDIKRSVKWWDKLMISRNRKTLIICNPCHQQIHTGTLPDMRTRKSS